ncbi:MAG TPA: amidohydrolase family protein [Sphingomicrobium sp.]|nr:amidohydrolase family protein [Sphingomicrobium sp.]
MIDILFALAAAQAAGPPIIDMHLHARRVGYTGTDPMPMCTPFRIMPRSDPKNGVLEGMEMNGAPCDAPVPAAKSDAEVLAGTIREIEANNIFGVLSGEPALVEQWLAASPRFMPAIDYRLPGTPSQAHVAPKSLDQLRALHRAGKLTVIGEIMAQYEGVPVDDPRMDPLWALAAELDVPVAIHMGPGEPGEPYTNGGAYLAALSDPLRLESVLKKYPKLRVSLMHAAYPHADRLRALLFNYPHVYAEIGSIVYTEPRPAFYAFLKEIVDAGYGDRILFGSDQMIWPGVISRAVQAIEEAPFLTREQKRDIFYNNAARFLRLPQATIDRHHGRVR